MDPHGATVIITGASSGIGAAAARVFAAAGATVILAARSASTLEELAATLPGQPLVVPTDMGDADQVRSLVERTIAARGQIDILINNAGIGLTGAVEAFAPADLEQVLQVDLFGPLYAIQAVVPHMRRQQRGQIINVSSVLGVRALPRVGGYAAAKGALERLSESLRTEVRGSGIVVTTVRPGRTQTPFAERRLGHEREQWRPRGVAPEVVAHTLLRAARKEPRVAYVRPTDRLLLLLAMSVPGVVDWLLARLARWEQDN
jgi:short-subunit dehydrogenase